MYESELCHYGIKGMKWGVRRYQKKDGTLTKEGKERNIYRNNIIRNRPYTDDVNDIVRTLSNKEKNFWAHLYMKIGSRKIMRMKP